MQAIKQPEFVPFVREDGTVEMRNKNYESLLAHPKPPSDFVVIPPDEINRYESTRYQRERVAEYPSIGDQLDALFHAGVFPPEMAARIQEVKTKYPKPE